MTGYPFYSPVGQPGGYDMYDSLTDLLSEGFPESTAVEVDDGTDVVTTTIGELAASVAPIVRRTPPPLDTPVYAGYIIAGLDGSRLEAYWDGEVHPTIEQGIAELEACRARTTGAAPLYDWNLYGLKKVDDQRVEQIIMSELPDVGIHTGADYDAARQVVDGK